MPATGARDPARTLALLWRQPARRRPGPDPARSVDEVVGVAVALAVLGLLASARWVPREAA